MRFCCVSLGFERIARLSNEHFCKMGFLDFEQHGRLKETKLSWWSLFWGLFLILFGVSVLLQAFGIDIPVFRIALAVLVIAFGLKMLIPQSKKSHFFVSRSSEHETIFSDSKLSGQKFSGEHRVIFGSTEVDLRDVQIQENDVEYRFDVVFGSLKIKLDSAKPILISGDATFAGISLPNGNSTAFGHVTYTSPQFKESLPAIKIRIKSVFGGVEVE